METLPHSAGWVIFHVQVQVTEWKDFTPTLNSKKMILAPICSDMKVEVDIKKKSAEVRPVRG